MLSKNEQIVVYVLAVLVIGVAGVLLFVMKDYKQIAVNQATYDQKAAELEDLKTRLSPAVEAELDAKIKTAYEEGDKVSQFFNEEMTEYEADRMLRAFLADVKDPYDYKTPVPINTDNMDIVGLATETLSIEKFKEEPITYAIKEKSNIDTSIYGNTTPETVDEAIENLENMSEDVLIMTLLSMPQEEAAQFYEDNKEKLSPSIQAAMREVLALTSETVAVQKLTFTIPLTSSEASAIAMHTLKTDKAIMINEFTFDDLQVQLDEEGEDVPTVKIGGSGGENEGIEIKVPQNVRQYTITISFYCVKRMDKPNF